jgi:pimeloyl-ACP methyl ester carboxylesterase
VKRQYQVLVLFIVVAIVVAAGWFVYQKPGGKPSPTPAASGQSSTQRLETALSAGASTQASVLTPTLRSAAHGQPVIPAGASIQLQPGTFRSSGNYAVVQGTVTGSGHQALAIGLVLSRTDSGSPWQVASLTAPMPATPLHTLGSAENTAFVTSVGATSGGCSDIPQGKTPVVFVHGLNARPSVWGNATDSTSFIGRVGHITGAYSVPFDYSSDNLHWVTNSNIGARLAETILCLTQKSGTKAIVIAHSMGGLALKEAIKEQPQVAQELGLVVTIATPNDGTVIDTAMLAALGAFCVVARCGHAYNDALQLWSALPALSYQSDQIRALPEWPKTVPVYAIAGNIAPTVYTLTWGGLVGYRADYSGSDMLVTTNSALHGNTIGNQGGYREFNCTTSAIVVLPFFTQAPCDHNALLSNSDVESAVAQQIQRYVAAQPKPSPTPEQTTTAPVTTAAPAPSTNTACSPSLDRVEQVVGQYNQAHGLNRSLQTVQTLCKKGWAVIRVKSYRATGDPTLTGVVYIALQHVGNNWNVVDSGDSSVCQQLPADTRYGMCS